MEDKNFYASSVFLNESFPLNDIEESGNNFLSNCFIRRTYKYVLLALNLEKALVFDHSYTIKTNYFGPYRRVFGFLSSSILSGCLHFTAYQICKMLHIL